LVLIIHIFFPCNTVVTQKAQLATGNWRLSHS